jgi:hypothetical protein
VPAAAACARVAFDRSCPDRDSVATQMLGRLFDRSGPDEAEALSPSSTGLSRPIVGPAARVYDRPMLLIVVNRRVGTASPLLSPHAWSVLGVLTVNVTLFDRHERDSDRDHGDRNACGYPSADQGHCTAEHEDNGDRQQSDIPRRRLSELHPISPPFA